MNRIQVSENPRLLALTQALSSPALERYRNNPDSLSLANQIATESEIKIKKPFQLEATIYEKESKLSMMVHFIGPAVGKSPQLPPKPRNRNSLKWLLASFSALGSNSPYRPMGTLTPDFAKTIGAIVQGLDMRISQKPDIKQIIILAPSVQNYSLQSTLSKRFGFSILEQMRYYEGLAGTADVVGSTMQLNIPLLRTNPLH